MISRQICSSRSSPSSSDQLVVALRRALRQLLAGGRRCAAACRGARRGSRAAGRSAGCSARCWRARRAAGPRRPAARARAGVAAFGADDPAVLVGLQSAACCGSRWATTTSSSQLEKNTDEPGSPWRPARPRSWLSSRSVWCRPVPMTCRPPSSATSSWSASSEPPSRMSVPRPAIWVDTVTAPQRARLGDDARPPRRRSWR